MEDNPLRSVLFLYELKNICRYKNINALFIQSSVLLLCELNLLGFYSFSFIVVVVVHLVVGCLLQSHLYLQVVCI